MEEEYKLGLEQTFSQVNTYSSGATFTFELYVNVHTFRCYLYGLRLFCLSPECRDEPPIQFCSSEQFCFMGHPYSSGEFHLPGNLISLIPLSGFIS